MTQTKTAYSLKEVSESTSLSIEFLRKEIRHGKLKATKKGRRVLVLSEDLESYLKSDEGGKDAPKIAN